MIPATVDNPQPSNTRKPTKRQRHYVSPDAMLALERLVIGRECNGFDNFITERKTLAYQELIRLGLVVGSVTEVPGRTYPDVVVKGVTKAGSEVYQNNEKGVDPSTWGLRATFVVFVLVIIVGVIIYTIRRF